MALIFFSISCSFILATTLCNVVNLHFVVVVAVVVVAVVVLRVWFLLFSFVVFSFGVGD